MYSILYTVMCLKLETYKQLVRIIAAAMGAIVAVGIVRCTHTRHANPIPRKKRSNRAGHR